MYFLFNLLLIYFFPLSQAWPAHSNRNAIFAISKSFQGSPPPLTTLLFWRRRVPAPSATAGSDASCDASAATDVSQSPNPAGTLIELA
ncbi:hypothetical protein ACU8KH_06507 [Lachancea thermotolerans]